MCRKIIAFADIYLFQHFKFKVYNSLLLCINPWCYYFSVHCIFYSTLSFPRQSIYFWYKLPALRLRQCCNIYEGVEMYNRHVLPNTPVYLPTWKRLKSRRYSAHLWITTNISTDFCFGIGKYFICFLIFNIMFYSLFFSDVHGSLIKKTTELCEGSIISNMHVIICFLLLVKYLCTIIVLCITFCEFIIEHL